MSTRFQFMHKSLMMCLNEVNALCNQIIPRRVTTIIPPLFVDLKSNHTIGGKLEEEKKKTQMTNQPLINTTLMKSSIVGKTDSDASNIFIVHTCMKIRDLE